MLPGHIIMRWTRSGGRPRQNAASHLTTKWLNRDHGPEPAILCLELEGSPADALLVYDIRSNIRRSASCIRSKISSWPGGMQRLRDRQLGQQLYSRLCDRRPHGNSDGFGIELSREHQIDRVEGHLGFRDTNTRARTGQTGDGDGAETRRSPHRFLCGAKHEEPGCKSTACLVRDCRVHFRRW